MEQLIKKSKKLAFILRHKPEQYGIVLDSEGYAFVSDLKHHADISSQDLETIVATDSKGRYSFSSDKMKIRANQGHSTNVSLTFKESTEDIFIYHGTGKESLELIKASGGLKPMSRQYVHLSPDIHTAKSVAIRHSKDIIVFKVSLKELRKHNPVFLSTNNVYLTDFVPFELMEII